MVSIENQTIEQLQQRYEDFKAKKVKFETQRDSAREELESLRKQALELYGSEDVDVLKKKLENMKAENDRKRREYQASLDEIEANLNQVENDFKRTTDDH